MRHLLGILVVLAVLGAVVPGCGGGRERAYDGRLAAVDSMLRDEPDSALAIITALPTDCLATEHDRAYRDLLLTQARYRAYVTATSDSDINRAVAYFADCRPIDREKLTRAYIYKGAVMDELGHPDSAMLYYKHAEANAAPDDYFNLGYVKMRIATLYQDQLSQDSSAIRGFEEALKYFSLQNDTDYIISILGSLGAINGVTNPGKAKHYLDQAILLSQEFDPSLQYTHKSTLAGLYFYQKDYKAANKYAMDVLRNGKEHCDETQFYHYAIISYIELGHLDSARYIFNKMPTPIDAVDSMNYFDIFAELSEAENDHTKYKMYKERSHDITESILSESQKGKLAVAESEFNRMASKQYYEEKSDMSYRIILGILIIFILTIVIIAYYSHCKLMNRAREKNEMKKELEKALDELRQQAQKNKSVSALVAHRITALNELYQDIRVRIQDEDKVKRIIPLSSVFKAMSDRNEILNLNLKDKFWQEMELSVDGEYNGIFSYVKKNYPDLCEKDLKIFCLLCADLSPQIIKLCMGLTSARTITNYRSVIIKKKMGLDMSFDTFVEKYVNGEFDHM